MIIKKNLQFVKNDTIPIELSIPSKGSLVDLKDGWNVYLTYKEPQSNGDVLTIRINGVVKNFSKGVSLFYPSSRYADNITDSENIVSYSPFLTPGVYNYDVYRSKEFYYTSDDGEYVLVDNMYVAYDSGNTQHDNLRRYYKKEEKQHHYYGNINVIDTLSGS